MKSSDAEIKPAIFAPAIDPVLSNTSAISKGVSDGTYVAASVDISNAVLPNIPIIKVGLLIVIPRVISPLSRRLRLKASTFSFFRRLKLASKASLATDFSLFFFVSPDPAAVRTAISVAFCKRFFLEVASEISMAVPMPTSNRGAAIARKIDTFPDAFVLNFESFNILNITAF